MVENMRQNEEKLEVALPLKYQVELWQAMLNEAEPLIPTLDDLSRIADMVSSTSVRAGNAGRVHRSDWQRRLYDLKYKLLERAARLRKDGQGDNLDIGIKKMHTNRNGDDHVFTIVEFDFNFDGRMFRTDTRMFDWVRMLGKEKVRELFEPYDELRPEIGRRKVTVR